MGRRRVKEYDQRQRLLSDTDGAGRTVRYAYDSHGNKITMENAMGQITHYAYDRNKALVRVTYPDDSSATYAYDEMGQLVERKDAKGQITRFAYGLGGDPTNLTYYAANASVPSANYAVKRDPLGRVVEAVSGPHVETTTYDDASNRIDVVVDYGPFSKSYSRVRDELGRTVRFTGPDGVANDYSYSDENQLNQIQIGEQGLVTFSEPNDGHFTAMTLPGGVCRRVSFNESMYMVTNWAEDGAGQTLLRQVFGRNALENVATKDEDGARISYAYDGADQLVAVDHANGDATAYGYDPAGNRISVSSAVEQVACEYNELDQLIRCGEKTYEHDANGNLIVVKTNGETTRRFTYDELDRLIAVADAQGHRLASYAYDLKNRRIRKETPGSTNYYLYADEGLLAVYDEQGHEQMQMGYLPDSQWNMDPIYLKQGGRYSFYLADPMGTPVKLVDDGGAVVWSATYDAFGRAQVAAGTVVTNLLRGPGQVFDEETGLHYNNRRYYDPETGRFLSRDPLITPVDYNLYASSLNDPINKMDPTGLATYEPFNKPIVKLKGCQSPTKNGYTPGANNCGPAGGGIWRFVEVALVPEGWNPDWEYGINVTPPCLRHDKCYGTCCSDKYDCDKTFQEDIETVCDRWLDKVYGKTGTRAYGKGGGRAACLAGAAERAYLMSVFRFSNIIQYMNHNVLGYKETSFRDCDKKFCYDLAKTYRWGVAEMLGIGDGAWSKGQDEACCFPNQAKQLWKNSPLHPKD